MPLLGEGTVGQVMAGERGERVEVHKTEGYRTLHLRSHVGATPLKAPVVLLPFPVHVLVLVPTRENPVSQW